MGWLVGTSRATKTILISADGFRWDYYGLIPTPGIDQIKANGVQVKNLKNSFATVTFPNHYTLVTGLYEENHGIVDNAMFDPVFNESFDMGTVSPKWWQAGEPVWVTAHRAGIESVCVNWVGCGVPVEGVLPTVWNPYNGSISYEDRVGRIAENLQGPAQLGLLYFEEPDHSCHLFGPDSDQVLDAIRRVDNAILDLLSKVDIKEVNIVFTADHGGVAVGNDKVVVLEDYSAKPFSLVISYGVAVAHLWPTHEDDTESILADLSALPKHHANCFPKQAVPTRLHYSANRRIAPIVCIAELGWTIVQSKQDQERFHLKGSHGYDASKNEDSPMRPIFIAGGPDFRTQSIHEPPLPSFENVHIFALISTLLAISPHLWPSINGTTTAIHHLLRKSESDLLVDQSVVLQW